MQVGKAGKKRVENDFILSVKNTLNHYIELQIKKSKEYFTKIYEY